MEIITHNLQQKTETKRELETCLRVEIYLKSQLILCEG